MSLFLCARCDEFRDSDDGCEEFGPQLLCTDCGDALLDDEEEPDIGVIADEPQIPQETEND